MKTIKNMRITLIGGAGFIGHNLALYLHNHGAKVSVIDGLSVNNLLYLHSTDQKIDGDRQMYIRMINQRLEILEQLGVPLYVEDARDYHALSHTIGKIKPQIVVLLAAVAHANKSNKNPYATFDHSLRTLENALDSTYKSVEHFIYFSSSMIYGHFPKEGVTEETPCDPIGIYGSLKLAGEKMVKAYHNVYGMPYTIVRPSALYGQRCISRRVGQIFIENAIEGKDITINGDGSDRLDFTYIEDLCGGIKNIIENENSINETFNLTYGQSRSIAQMAELIHQNFPQVKINYLPKDKLVPDRGTLYIDKARDLIGYNPQYDLARGYVEYINWYKSFCNKETYSDSCVV